jgi:hypothetical protein
MNFSELQREVKAIVMDQSANILITIPDAINEAVQQVAEEVVLPSLKTLFTVTTNTSTYYVNFPSGFSGRLSYIGDTEGVIPLLDGGLEQLIIKHPDVTVVGDIEHLAQEGNVLYYLPIPSTAKSLTCIGYNYPATLVNDTDTPSDIPEMVHRETICFKAASIIYSYIEDGIEQEKVNTLMFAGLAKTGMDKLSAWAHRRRSNVGTSIWSQ